MRNVVLVAALTAMAVPAWGQTFSMDRMRDQTEIGLRMDFGFPRDQARDVTVEETFFRTELHGQVAMGDYGGYLSIPLARNIVSGDGREEITAFGNLELGGFQKRDLGPLDLILRLGLTLPTADDSIAGFSTNAFSNFARVTDHLNTQPNTFGLRMSASPVWNAGVVFLRADVGVDLLWDTAQVTHDDFQSFFRANVGLGANLGIVTLALESVNMVTMADSSFAFGEAQLDQTIHTMTAGAWANLGVIHPYISFTAPLDELSRDAYGFVFSMGADIRI